MVACTPRTKGTRGTTLGAWAAGFAAVVSSAPAGAQPAECTVRPNALVADVGLHVVNAGYQRTLGCVVSIQASAGLYVPWTVNNDVLGLGGGGHDPAADVAGLVLRVRSFVHPLGTAPTGLWLSPFVQGGIVRASRGAETLYGPAFAAGLSIGWTFRLGSRWLLALGAGGQYHAAAFAGTTAFPGFARLGPTVDINVDYRF